MRARRVLVSDLDGTLLADGAPSVGLPELRRHVDDHRYETLLVYATGRSFDSTWQLVEAGELPVPDAIAAAVGVEVWYDPWLEPDPTYSVKIRDRWDRVAVLEAAADLPQLTLQPDRFQHPLKVSFYTTRARTADTLRARLGDAARVIYSGGRYLDVVPHAAGKASATRHVCDTFGIDEPIVLAAGDSGNDRDMLEEPGFLGVAVGNAQPELGNIKRSSRFFAATRHHAAGVLEGARALGFFPARSQ